MLSVFNVILQTDMGKTIVRRHLANTDAQSVWRELSEHMRTSSKIASEKRRLTQYVTNTVLDDNFTGTTEQFVLHFNEQFRQLGSTYCEAYPSANCCQKHQWYLGTLGFIFT